MSHGAFHDETDSPRRSGSSTVTRCRRGSSTLAALHLPLLLLPLVSAPATAQSFGQWSWDARVGGAGRSYENELDGETTSELDQTDLELALGVNGYLLHPALGAFRLAAEFLVSDAQGGRSVDTDRVGLEARFDILPRSARPIQLYFDRDTFQYSGFSDDDVFSVVGVPEEVTRWGGRVRLKQGVVRGLLVGIDQAESELLGEGMEDELQETQFADWSRSGERLTHHARIEHQRREFGTIDLALEDLTVLFDQRGDLTSDWSWELHGTGIRRDLVLPGDAELQADSYRLRNRLTRPLREGRDLLDIQADLGEFSIGSDRTDSQDLTVFYRLRPRPGFEIAPFAQLVRRSSEQRNLEAPRAGARLSWNHRRGLLDAAITGRASYGLLRTDTPEGTGEDNELMFSASTTLGHGRETGLRKELEAEAGRHELRFSGEPLTDLPDLGLPRGNLDAEDFARARLSLRHRWDSRNLNGYGEWSRRDSTERFGLDFVSETVSANLQLQSAAFTVQTSLGQTRVNQEGLEQQRIDFVSSTVYWRPRRFLTLRGSYRTDDRRLPLVTDLTGDRVEVGLQLRAGQLTIEGRYYESNQRFSLGPDRCNRGLTWSITRRLGGWLPLVTGTQRRGVIR